jgi:hypothetical protein
LSEKANNLNGQETLGMLITIKKTRHDRESGGLAI